MDRSVLGNDGQHRDQHGRPLAGNRPPRLKRQSDACGADAVDTEDVIGDASSPGEPFPDRSTVGLPEQIGGTGDPGVKRQRFSAGRLVRGWREGIGPVLLRRI